MKHMQQLQPISLGQRNALKDLLSDFLPEVDSNILWQLTNVDEKTRAHVWYEYFNHQPRTADSLRELMRSIYLELYESNPRFQQEAKQRH